MAASWAQLARQASCRPVLEVSATQHPQGSPESIAPHLAPPLRLTAITTGNRHRSEVDAAAAGHDPSHQQSPVHVVTAGDKQGVADAGLAQIVHQGGEIGKGVASSVVELHLVGWQALALLKQPVGIFRITAATDHHRQPPAGRQSRRLPLPRQIAAQHQDHLGWRGRRPPPTARQPKKTTSQQQRHQPPGAGARPARAPLAGAPLNAAKGRALQRIGLGHHQSPATGEVG